MLSFHFKKPVLSSQSGTRWSQKATETELTLKKKIPTFEIDVYLDADLVKNQKDQIWNIITHLELLKWFLNTKAYHSVFSIINLA